MTDGAPGWRIRSAGAADAAALALVGSATFLDGFAGILPGAAIIAHCTRASSSDAFAAMLGGGGRAWLGLAEPGEAPVGYALLMPPDLPGAAPGDIELRRIYTLSRYHGSGLGPALMATAIADAQARAAADARLLLGVHTGNARARAFYTRHGFTQIATRRFDVGGTICDDVVLARPLNANR
ncbi:GNAT family N-acetyltransferase [Sphingomonas changnyeongensis]|uniref:GNAT family N-acetyltransferase n=1 Tax=Sphingomonas changnyeongensis TaxID=2698679 RepID=A0A7Z2NXK1_9SPHN|nr:GNAT family N-acetyltransferase [Sphingomonas changnyeongensis]QHL91286.1 GNAT family N-acetyltransferase [Sphingomonas changnyeongensis]